MLLSRIINEFDDNPTLCLSELSQKLAIEASALEGMLQTLVRKGRLLEIDPGAGSSCQLCPARGGCLLIEGLGKSYLLMPRPEPNRA